MPTLDATDSASPTVGEILAKWGVDPKTGLNPADVQERLTKYGQTRWRKKRKARWPPSSLISGVPYHG